MKEKLVRDRIPEIVGDASKFRQVQGEEYRTFLIEKLKEETEELIEALKSGDEGAIIEEMGDVNEIIQAIKDQYNIGHGFSENEQTLKYFHRGGFVDGWVMKVEE